MNARASRLLRSAAGAAWFVAIYLFLLAPLIVVVGASFNGGERTFINFPPTDISLKWYGRMDPVHVHALWVSLALGVIAAVAATLMGVPAAMGLVRTRFRGKAFVSALFRAPLQIPAVVIGVSFLKMYYLLGDITGFYATGSLLGLGIAHSFMATPYVIGSVSAILQRFNLRLEEAAFSLGASRWRVFRRVTLPLIMPGIYTGAMYAFLVSFGDVPVSLFLGTSGFTTFPVEIFHAMEFDFNPAILAMSSLIVLFSIALMLGLQRAVGLETLLRSGGSN